MLEVIRIILWYSLALTFVGFFLLVVIKRNHSDWEEFRLKAKKIAIIVAIVYFVIISALFVAEVIL